MSRKYYSLHVHTNIGSIGDSILRIPDYAKRAKEFGLNAIAVTDHGSMSAMYAILEVCQKNDLKPIIGMEPYVVPNNNLEYQKENKLNKGAGRHLVLLAKTTEGFKNLLKIHNQAQIEGFYHTPRTDLAHLKKWGKGIIGLSACVSGEIPKAILENDFEKAESLINDYKEAFDEFYLEIQPGQFNDQLLANQGLVMLAKKTNTPIVVTNDVHYLNPEDCMTHDYHVKLKRKKFDPGMVYADTCYWFMDYEEITAGFAYDNIVTRDIVEEGIKNAELIAEKCNVEFSSEMFMPKFNVPSTETEESWLYKKCYEKLAKVIENKSNPQDYIDRLEYELKVIKEKGFCGYFLIVQDYLEWARKNNIPVGPGRGSAAGSLVSNLLNISTPDPLKYGLMFERFLDPHREAIPDIDSDLSADRRDELFKYVSDKYGMDHCARICALHVRKAKGAIRDAARCFKMQSVGDTIAKLIPEVYYGDGGEKVKDMDLKTCLEKVPELRKLREAYPNIFDLAIALEGQPNSTSLHAAGIIISPKSLQDMIPLVRSEQEGVLTTSLTLEEAERQLVKYDFLSLSTLRTIKNTENDIGWSFDYSDDELFKDEETWNILGTKQLTGLFQVGSPTYKSRMHRIKPKNINELANAIALIRGPSISAGTDETYMQILEGKKEVVKVHPIFDEITASTNGVLIYQEQVMQLAVKFGMDLTTGYRIVKAGAKKKMDVLKSYREEFLKLAPSHDCDEETANKMFDLIEKSAEYSFNKSHAVSYALVTYASAYLKVHYPLEFSRNMLTNAYLNKKGEIEASVKDCKAAGIKFLPADLFKSKWEFAVEDGKIRIGLCAIKGFGEKVANAVEGLNFNSLESFYGYLDDKDTPKEKRINKGAITIAILSGALDSLRNKNESRHQMYQRYIALRNKTKDVILTELELNKKHIIPLEDADNETLEQYYFEANLVYDPTDQLDSFGWDNLRIKESFTTTGYIKKVKEITTKAKKKMAFILMGTGDGDINTTVFPLTYSKYKNKLKQKKMVRFSGVKDKSDACILNVIKEGKM